MEGSAEVEKVYDRLRNMLLQPSSGRLEQLGAVIMWRIEEPCLRRGARFLDPSFAETMTREDIIQIDVLNIAGMADGLDDIVEKPNYVIALLS